MSNAPLDRATDRCAGRYLTPLHLEIIIWYHSRVADMENLRAPATSEYVGQLVADGILESTAGQECLGRSYRTTQKGDAFLGALLMVPYPIQRWEPQWPT